MHEIVENVFTRAAEIMHDSCLRMDEDHVGKPLLGIFTSGSRLVVPRIGVSEDA